MTYKLSWLLQDEVLSLILPSLATIDTLRELNQDITDILDNSSSKVIILLNLEQMKTTYNTADQLRNTQLYIVHHNLDCMLIMAGNKLNRLISLLAFSTARSPVIQFDNQQQVDGYFKRRGITISAS